MNTPHFSFSSNPENRFPVPPESDARPEAKIDLENGVLRIVSASGKSTAYPLVLNGEPNPLAIFISQPQGCPPQLEIGTVDYGDQALYLENYPVNEGDFRADCDFGLIDGHVGILDLRNLRVSTQTRFFPEMVPIQLAISGIYLRATTIGYTPASGQEPWYIKSNL